MSRSIATKELKIKLKDPNGQLIKPSDRLPEDYRECVLWVKGFQFPVIGTRWDDNWYFISQAYKNRSIHFQLIEAEVRFWAEIPTCHIPKGT